MIGNFYDEKKIASDERKMRGMNLGNEFL